MVVWQQLAIRHKKSEEQGLGEENAQACSGGSAVGKTGDPDAWNGRGEHDFHGGCRTGAAGTFRAGRFADADGHDPAGKTHGRTNAEN